MALMLLLLHIALSSEPVPRFRALPAELKGGVTHAFTQGDALNIAGTRDGAMSFLARLGPALRTQWQMQWKAHNLSEYCVQQVRAANATLVVFVANDIGPPHTLVLRVVNNRGSLMGSANWTSEAKPVVGNGGRALSCAVVITSSRNDASLAYAYVLYLGAGNPQASTNTLVKFDVDFNTSAYSVAWAKDVTGAARTATSSSVAVYSSNDIVFVAETVTKPTDAVPSLALHGYYTNGTKRFAVSAGANSSTGAPIIAFRVHSSSAIYVANAAGYVFKLSMQFGSNSATVRTVWSIPGTNLRDIQLSPDGSALLAVGSDSSFAVPPQGRDPQQATAPMVAVFNASGAPIYRHVFHFKLPSKRYSFASIAMKDVEVTGVVPSWLCGSVAISGENGSMVSLAEFDFPLAKSAPTTPSPSALPTSANRTTPPHHSSQGGYTISIAMPMAIVFSALLFLIALYCLYRHRKHVDLAIRASLAQRRMAANAQSPPNRPRNALA